MRLPLLGSQLAPMSPETGTVNSKGYGDLLSRRAMWGEGGRHRGPLCVDPGRGGFVDEDGFRSHSGEGGSDSLEKHGGGGKNSPRRRLLFPRGGMVAVG